MEHRPADRGRHGAVRRHRHPRGLVRRAHRPAGSPDLGRAGRGALRHPRLRGELRLGVAQHLGQRLPGRGARDDPGRLSARLPAGRGQPPQRRPGQEEVARSLGLGRLATFLRVTLGQARGPSSAAACWSLSCSWPSSAPSRSSATRHSPPRSSPSSRSLQRARGLRPLAGAGGPRRSSSSAGRPARPGAGARAGTGAARAARPPSPRAASRAGARRVRLLVALALGVPIGAERLLDVQGGQPDRCRRRRSLGARPGTRPLRRRRRRPGDAWPPCPVALLAVRFPRPRGPPARAQHLPRARDARAGDRPRPRLLRRALRQRVPYQTRAAAGPRLRHLVLPARPARRLRASVARSRSSLEEVARSLGVPRCAVFWRVTLR